VKWGKNEIAQMLCKQYMGSWTCVCRTADGVSVVSDSEVVVMFVTVDGEDPARNISERHKIVKS
jgi:hypothetical protein